MFLVYFPVNAAWAFIIGEDVATASPVAMADYPLFFRRRDEAVKAAKTKGLGVDKKGKVFSL